MSFRALLSAQNPLWRQVGLAVLLVSIAGTGYYIYKGPRPLKPTADGRLMDHGIVGRSGTYTELLQKSRFLLNYESIVGSSENVLQLHGVDGHLEEPKTLWALKSPSAKKTDDVWFLDGPMDIEARDPKLKAVTGKGRVDQAGPALKWDKGVWTGLSTLVWESLDGKGQGKWTFPPGWRRELDERFVVENKPVRWEATGPGALRAMDTQSMWVTPGFTNGHLEQVHGVFQDGQIQAAASDIDPALIHWIGPIHFQRNDGWIGDAESGLTPRPPEGGSVQLVELKTFDAHRKLAAGMETIHAEGARWTPAGVRAEGDVRWDQPRDGSVLTLRAPRVLIREAPGEDLPPDLPVGEARAEGSAVLTWGNRSLSSPTMDVRRVERTWKIQAPVLGRSEQGTFSAGAGKGTPDHWEFEGPIRAATPTNGNLRGDKLVWDKETWTLTGRPATWDGLRERLSGPKIVRKDDLIQFPDGLNGAFSAPEGDIVIRADHAEAKTGVVRLSGRVDCQGLGWHLQGDQATVYLGPDNHLKTITSKGAVTLRGNISQGKGESLDLDLEKGVARWQGLVKGLTEVEP
jgi:hypothetical protein